MAAVLGVSANYHDAAAALVVDGQVRVAIQQERLSRIKNDPTLPLEAAQACLAHAGLRAEQLDAVAFYERPFHKLERVMVSMLRNLPRSWRQFPRAMASQLGGNLWVLDHLAEGLGVQRKKVKCLEHHRTHAAAAAFTSPYEACAVLVLDGVGEQSSTTTWHANGTELRGLESIDFPHSLGLLYAAITAWLGFAVNEGEYKVMGLAAWGRAGTDGLRESFERLITLQSDGAYHLHLPYFAHMSDANLGFGPQLEALLGPRRAAGKKWDFDDPADRHYANVAATLQRVLEDALLGLSRRLRQQLPGVGALCLGGGVALNSVANARLARESGFDRVFVQPAAGDAGGALGAAILASIELGDGRPAAMRTAALGVEVDTARAHGLAKELGLTVLRVSEPSTVAATLIAQDKIIAVVRGRFEWGPRALGQRSVFASPRARATRDRINHLIKQRESFRPFAPAVLKTDTNDFFEGDANDMTPFMTSVLPIRPECAGRLGAVRHEDGTARVQTVCAQSAPALNEVLTALKASGHDPIALNTSLNGPGEPIVAGAEDALAFFMRHKVDSMLIEDLRIDRPE
ncbi:MAG: carbamoyltransferase family protein [Nannocystales bacterium]